jgi:hypothetical protein
MPHLSFSNTTALANTRTSELTRRFQASMTALAAAPYLQFELLATRASLICSAPHALEEDDKWLGRAEAAAQQIVAAIGAKPQDGRSDGAIQLERIVFLQELLQQNASLFTDAHDLGADTRFADVFDLDPAAQESVGVKLALEIEDLPDGELLIADDEETLAAEVLQQAGHRGTADQ